MADEATWQYEVESPQQRSISEAVNERRDRDQNGHVRPWERE